MTNILVTYASKHGATAEIAQSVARVLKAYKLNVTARRVEYIEDISEHDIVILGAALYLGEWIPEAVDFLTKYQEELQDKLVWLFVSGPTGDGEPVELVDGEFIPLSLTDMLEKIAPRDVKLFKGKIDLRRLPPDERKVVKAANVPRGDYRDWKAVHVWAEDIGKTLSAKSIIRKPEQHLMLVED